MILTLFAQKTHAQILLTIDGSFLKKDLHEEIIVYVNHIRKSLNYHSKLFYVYDKKQQIRCLRKILSYNLSVDIV